MPVLVRGQGWIKEIFIPPFSIASWEIIDKVSKAGRAAEFWNLGDTKEITLTNGKVITVRLEDFDHDDLVSDGKAKLSMLALSTIKDRRKINSTGTNVGGWGASELRAWLNSEFKAMLPSELQQVIKRVKKRTSAGNKSTSIVTTQEDIWIPTYTEVGFLPDPTYSPGGEGTAYPLLNSDTARNKGGIWWLSSPCLSVAGAFCDVNTPGTPAATYANAECGILPGFCI